MTLRACDCQSFAGAFTLGVKQAGYELVGKREMPGGFGVPSVARNHGVLGDFPIQVASWEDWDGVEAELVFGNPPCSAFSNLGKRGGEDDPISSCMYAFADFVSKCKPYAAIFESVQGAYTLGRPMMQKLRHMVEQQTHMTWDLHHVFQDANVLGAPSNRPRYFWCVVPAGMPIGFAVDSGVGQYVMRDAIGDLEGLDWHDAAPQPYVVTEINDYQHGMRHPSGKVDGHRSPFDTSDHKYAMRLLEVLEAAGIPWVEGTQMSLYLNQAAELATEDEWPTMMPARFVRSLQDGNARPGVSNFETRRWFYDKPARVVAGNTAKRCLHPIEPRTLTLRETFRIQGFPDTWELGGLIEQYGYASYLWPGKGIPVQVGRWAATCIAEAIDGHPRQGLSTLVGDREWLWDVRGARKVASGSARRAITTEETMERSEIQQALATNGTVQVDLNGLIDVDAKRRRELIYQAAYALGRKVSVKVDKATNIATGTLKDEAHVPGAKKATPASTSGDTVYDPTNPVPGSIYTREDGARFRLSADMSSWEDMPAPTAVTPAAVTDVLERARAAFSGHPAEVAGAAFSGNGVPEMAHGGVKLEDRPAAEPGTAITVTFRKINQHEWHWTCARCGTKFVRTSGGTIADWALTHGETCTGP